MKTILQLLTLALTLSLFSCSEKTEDINIDMNAYVYGKFTENEKYKSMSKITTTELYSYNIYLHKGKVKVTDELLKNPQVNAEYFSIDNFSKDIKKGDYTVIAVVSATNIGKYVTYKYEGTAYTYVNYPDTQWLDFYFDFYKESDYNTREIYYRIKKIQ